MIVITLRIDRKRLWYVQNKILNKRNGTVIKLKERLRDAGRFRALGDASGTVFERMGTGAELEGFIHSEFQKIQEHLRTIFSKPHRKSNFTVFITVLCPVTMHFALPSYHCPTTLM
jgi:hypothetical protein